MLISSAVLLHYAWVSCTIYVFAEVLLSAFDHLTFVGKDAFVLHVSAPDTKPFQNELSFWLASMVFKNGFFHVAFLFPEEVVCSFRFLPVYVLPGSMLFTSNICLHSSFVLIRSPSSGNAFSRFAYARIRFSSSIQAQPIWDLICCGDHGEVKMKDAKHLTKRCYKCPYS